MQPKNAVIKSSNMQEIQRLQPIKEEKSLIFPNSLLFRKFYAPKMQNPLFMDGVKSLSAIPPELPAESGNSGILLFSAIVTYVYCSEDAGIPLPEHPKNIKKSREKKGVER